MLVFILFLFESGSRCFFSTVFTKLTDPQASKASPISAIHLPPGALVLQILPLPIWLLCVFEDLNSSPYVYLGNIFTHHTSLQMFSLACSCLVLSIPSKASWFQYISFLVSILHMYSGQNLHSRYVPPSPGSMGDYPHLVLQYNGPEMCVD